MTLPHHESVTCPRCQHGPFSPNLLVGMVVLVKLTCLKCGMVWYEEPKTE